jgi:hypothetical protein
MTQHILHALSKALPAQHFWKVRLLQQWPHIIGKLQEKVSLYKVEETFVVLQVKHASLAHELLFLTEMLKEKINQVIGCPRITSIHFRTQQAKKAPAASTRSYSNPLNSRPTPTLNVGEKKVLEAVENEDLRDALSAFYRTCKKRQS